MNAILYFVTNNYANKVMTKDMSQVKKKHALLRNCYIYLIWSMFAQVVASLEANYVVKGSVA